MDKLKTERSVARRLFTRAKTELNLNLEAQEDDRVTRIQDAFKYLTEKAEVLFSVDERMKNQWLSSDELNEDDFLKDCESADGYKKEWIELQNICEKIFRQKDRESQYDSASVSSNEGKRALRLPKLELAKFDGNAKNWLGFWSSFKKIHQDSTIDIDDKMAYLIQSMAIDSPAAELVKSYPPCGENYSQAIDQLKSRYARDELLIEIYVRELLTLVLQQAKIGNESSSINLSSLYDKLKTQLRALEILGVTSEKYAAMLYPLVESALPTDILRVWERQRNRDNSVDVLNNLLNFMKVEVESEERIQLTRQGLGDKTYQYEVTKVPTAACLVAGDSQLTAKSSLNGTVHCIWCEKTTHGSHECIKAQKMSLEERKKLITKKKACFICLKTNHAWRRCKMYPKCIGCQKRHAVLLCPEINKNVGSSGEQTLAARSNGTTLLQTLLVKIGDETVRAFIDTGSQRSYIRKDIASKLQLKSKGEEILKHYLFGGVETKKESHQVYELTVKDLKGKNTLAITALNKDKICGYIPRIRTDSTINKKLQKNNLTLTDIGENTPDVGLLIGADYAGRIMTESVIHIDRDLYAIQTKLGWSLQGMVPDGSKDVIATVGLTDDISNLWNLEVLGIEDPKDKVGKQKSEEQSMEDFKESVSINDENRYEVSLPWKIDRPELLDNRELAEKRLRSTTKRLESLNELQNYENVFKEWLDLGIIEVETDVDSPGHYLCHHAVIKESSSTTRVRPVFDASAKDFNGNSINACLEKGQNFLELIPILLTRFRMHAVGVTSDIKKAFLQISLRKEDRKFLRFLWWSEEGNIVVYRHCRVVFGLTCSPFLLAATLIYHLENFTLSNRANTAELLKNSFYVDNCVVSLESQQEADKFIDESKLLMNEGQFELRGWVTAPVQCKGSEKENTISVLGMNWDTQSDELRCNLRSMRACKDRVTRRELLSICNRVFDTIGFTSPTTLIPKLLLQRTWSLNIGWDVQLPDEICKEFKAWVEEVHLLAECQVPRRLTVESIKDTKLSLHVFSDASKHAYACCIFLRSEAESKEVTVQLVMAKSRVTPVKEVTIPRLELIAALMSTRLYVQVRDALRLENCKVYFWSDSAVAVTWITTEKDWSVFVRNRVREIRETTQTADWRHISGSQNPADLPSRGCSAKKLVDTQWWKGPAWLKESEENWLKSFQINVQDKEVDTELRRSKSATNNVDSTSEIFSSRLTNLSKFSKIVRTVAWILRFRNNCKENGKRKGDVTLDEIASAQIVLFRLIQEESFLSTNARLKGVKNLDIFKDEKGVMKVKTRLTLSEEEENFKYPILLCGKHPIIERMVEQRHIHYHHAGLNFMSSILRNDFWILGGRKLIRSVISKCIICKRFRAESYQTETAPLPKNRVKNAAVFQVTGVDAAGPLILNTGEKCWIILFTCAIYRAVHLELILSMSTECFLMALRRFIARRGRVHTIYSDNGTNFVGAENILSNINWQDLNEYCSIRKIKWIFNPPAAPWWGGWWERLIQMIKQLLRRSLGRAVLSFVELETLLCDIESIVNARPLTYIAQDDEYRPLTPACFLFGLEGSEVTDLDAADTENLRTRHRYLQKLRVDLRERFRTEYLSLLVSRCQKSNKPIQEGDIVIVETEAKRTCWPLGIVTEIYPGKDKQIRVAKVKTADGFRTRPVQKLYPLEISQAKNEEAVEPENQPQEPLKSRSGRIVKVPRRLDLSFSDLRSCEYSQGGGG